MSAGEKKTMRLEQLIGTVRNVGYKFVRPVRGGLGSRDRDQDDEAQHHQRPFDAGPGAWRPVGPHLECVPEEHRGARGRREGRRKPGPADRPDARGTEDGPDEESS